MLFQHQSPKKTLRKSAQFSPKGSQCDELISTNTVYVCLTERIRKTEYTKPFLKNMILHGQIKTSHDLNNYIYALSIGDRDVSCIVDMNSCKE